MLRVLVPSDGSVNSQYGVRHVAGEYMKHKNLDIHILNVQRPFSRYVSRFAERRARTDLHQAQANKALMPALQALDDAGVPYTVHAEVGDQAACIAESASRLGCHRIVMGTARKSALVRFLQDSVTNRVIERTTVPVQVIAGDAASTLGRVGVPAGVGAGLFVLLIASQ